MTTCNTSAPAGSEQTEIKSCWRGSNFCLNCGSQTSMITKEELHVKSRNKAPSVLNFRKKILGPAGPQVFILGSQNKYSRRQN